jgi:hypothetical protein
LSPQEIEGGFEIYDIAPDVIASGDIISLSTAWHAARTALRYWENADSSKYPYVKTTKKYRSGGGIATVGVWSPLEYNPKNTIIANQNEVNRSKSFVMAAKALCRFAGTSLEEVNRVHVMVVPDGDFLGFHTDKYDGARSIIQLMGYREVEFVHPYTEVSASTSAFLFPSDAYRMQFRDDSTSIMHAVSYIGHGPGMFNVGIYINS